MRLTPDDPESRFARELRRLVAARSVTSESNGAAARGAARLLAEAGFRVRTQVLRKGGKRFVNVVGVKGKGPAPLLLAAHLDTVPPGDRRRWTRTGGDPWRAVVRGGRLYGLGAADDKASFVAMAAAGAAFPAGALRRPVVVLGSFGEESGMDGAKLFTRAWRGSKPGLAFVGEPTALEVTYRHKGMGVLEIELESRHALPASGPRRAAAFRGKQAHSSRPWLGRNALDLAAAAIGGAAWIERLEGGAAPNLVPADARVVTRSAAGSRSGAKVPAFPAGAVLAAIGAVRGAVRRRARQKDPSFRPSVLTSNFGTAATDGRRLRLAFDFRLLPGQRLADVRREIDAALRRAARRDRRVRFRTLVERDNPPLGLRRGDPCVRYARRFLRAQALAPVLSTKPSCTEAGLYAAWGVPAVVFGPGRAAGNIHAPNENVRLAEVRRAARAYAALIRDYCAGAACS
jgi:acetylornithine deacetylase/succinyl-diaminopimelate desuccinylase-like protein